MLTSIENARQLSVASCRLSSASGSLASTSERESLGLPSYAGAEER